jgi:hypothetical protein
MVVTARSTRDNGTADVQQLRQPARVLREVYHGVRETLFDEYSCDDPDAPDE